MTRKQPVILRGLGKVVASRGRVEDPFRFHLFFRDADGPGDIPTRPARAKLTSGELAQLLGAIPARLLEDPEDLAAVARVQNVLRRSQPSVEHTHREGGQVVRHSHPGGAEQHSYFAHAEDPAQAGVKL